MFTKIQNLVLLVMLLLGAITLGHSSTVEYVNANGVRVTTDSLTAVVDEQRIPELLSKLNIHHPVFLSGFPQDYFKNPLLVHSTISLRRTGDGKIKITGATYEQLRQLGFRLPLFIIQ